MPLKHGAYCVASGFARLVRAQPEPLEVLVVLDAPDPAHEAALGPEREVELEHAVRQDGVVQEREAAAEEEARPTEMLLEPVLLGLDPPRQLVHIVDRRHRPPLVSLKA
jgi:hypothetical protein